MILGSSEVLETEDLHKLVVSLQDEYKSEKMDAIYRSLIPVLWKNAQKYSRNEYDREDLVLMAYSPVRKSTETWDSSGGSKFMSYALQKVSWFFREQAKRKWNQVCKLIPEENEYTFETLSANAYDCGKENREYVNWLLENCELDRRSLLVLTEHYLENKKLQEIKEDLGLTSQRVSQIRIKALQKVRLFSVMESYMKTNGCIQTRK
jgi:RNA polymerase sigma factor (sigma-70 family)